MRNIALRIEYDGTDFVGSQWQNNGRSVQGELEGAWEQLTQERRRVNLAGRTDAGAHARGQVASVRTEARHDLATIQRGLNAILPEDVAVLEAWEVAYEFHARHSAIRRDYRYLIDNGPAGSPLLRRHAAMLNPQIARVEPLIPHRACIEAIRSSDVCVVNAVGNRIPCKVYECMRAGKPVLVLIGVFALRRWGQPLIAVDLAANAFLRHMVRNIVGTLLLVGEGKIDSAAFAAVFAGRDRRRAGRTAPAHGLYLMSVSYP